MEQTKKKRREQKKLQQKEQKEEKRWKREERSIFERWCRKLVCRITGQQKASAIRPVPQLAESTNKPRTLKPETLDELVSQISTHEIEETLGQQANSHDPNVRLASSFGSLHRVDRSSLEKYVRTMYVVPEGEIGPGEYIRTYGYIDTGAQVSITYEDVLADMGLDYHRIKCPPLQPLGNRQDTSELMLPKGIKPLVWYDGVDERFEDPLMEPFFVLPSPENGNRPYDFLLSAGFVQRAKLRLGRETAEVSMLSMVLPASQHR